MNASRTARLLIASGAEPVVLRVVVGIVVAHAPSRTG
jgi:hypothetical protein